MRAEQRLAEIVLTAGGLEDPERDRYLDEVAAEAPDLAALARRRLGAAADLPDFFLETPAAERLGELPDEANPADPSTEQATLPPEERYELGDGLGEGGMGRVIEAFDRQLGRPVALKFLHLEDPEILRLFLREARAQARVQHPHVLPIYDTGELDGQPFLSVRHIAHGTLGEVGPSLSLEHRVRLLIQAAEGLHAAHREGLLHRDVKPSNILVDRNPDGDLVALVTDFGLAAEVEDGTDGAVEAGEEAVGGSPHFIAPERLEGSAGDRRSDVYSFGVTMYRLLTGTLPFAGRNTLGVLEGTLHQELPPPRLHRPDLPVELEAIVLRCLAREPNRRYASARAVAEDLQRFLDGEVTEAYTSGVAYRLTRFALRHKVLVSLAAAALVLLLAASVAVAVFAWRADRARRQAEMRQGQAEEMIRFLVVDLRETLDEVGRLDVLEKAHHAATEYFAAVPEEALSEAELLRRSRMLYQIGEVRIRQGDLSGAVRPLEESLALAQRLVALAPADGERLLERLFELGQSHFWVGFVHWEQGDLRAARRPLEEYLAVSRRLVEEDPENLAWRQELSYAHSNLGSLLQAEGDLNGALEQFLAALAIDERLVAADPDNSDVRSELAATHNTVGRALQDLGRPQEAGEQFSADLAVRRDLLAADPENPHWKDLLATSHSRLGSHRLMLGAWEVADEHLRQAQAAFAELVKHDPANAPWRLKLAWTHLHLGSLAYARADLGAAEAHWEQQRTLTDDIPTQGKHHAWVRTRAIGLHHRALLKTARGEPSDNEAFEAVEILRELAAERPTDREVHRWLARSYLLLGSLQDSPAVALDSFRHAEETLLPFLAGSSKADGRLLAPWAAALRCLGRREEAQPALTRLDEAGYAEPTLPDPCR